MEFDKPSGNFRGVCPFNRAKAILAVPLCGILLRTPNLVCTDADVQVTFGFLNGQERNARHSVKGCAPETAVRRTYDP